MVAPTRYDWSAFHRLDNAAVIDLLTSSAGVFAQHGILDSKEVDNLRLVLSGIQSDGRARDASVLLELLDQNAEYLGVVTAWFGSAAFGVNLMRHSLRPHLIEVERSVADFGQALLKKAELLFNRPFVRFDGENAECRTVFASPLLDCANVIAKSSAILESVRWESSTMAATAVAGAGDFHANVDADLANALGFDRVEPIATPGAEETSLVKRLAQGLDEMCNAVDTLLKGICRNADANRELPAAVAIDWVRTECRRLASLEMPQAGSLMSWEIRRSNLGTSLLQLAVATKSLSERTMATISTAKDHCAHVLLTEDIRCRLAIDLIASGVAPRTSWDAVHALETYLQEQGVAPRQVIGGEAGKIHPAMTAQCLQTLREFDDNQALMPNAAMEKDRNLKRTHSLKSLFRRTLERTSSLGVLLLFIVGCGLKTSPKSDVAELRPDIPFHEMANPLGDRQNPAAKNASKAQVQGKGSVPTATNAGETQKDQ